MASEVTSIRQSFAKYTNALPDEMFVESTESEIEQLNKKLLELMQKDYSTIKSLAGTKKASRVILNKMMQSRAQFIKQAYIRYSEYDKTNKAPLGYLLSHWFLCKGALERIPGIMLQELKNTRQMNLEYNNPSGDSQSKRSAYIRFTRAYQAFLGCAVNILDVIEEYVSWFNRVCKTIDPSYRFTGGSHSAWIYDYEIITGAYELLLRANLGRFTCVPLIRSAIEIKLSRLFLEPFEGSKFRGCGLVPVGRFDIMDFMQKYGTVLGITFRGIDLDAMSRIYDWGSVVLHRGWRMNHCEMWYALNIAESTNAFVQIDKRQFSRSFDKVIDDLIKAKLVKVETRARRARFH